MDDRTLIKTLGGPTEVARLLGYDPEKGGTQRVHNWMVRGIPAAVKLAHQRIFFSNDAGSNKDAA